MESVAKYVYEVYKKGSFTRAAKELYISQPSLSAAISRLEAGLGFRIFDRTTIPCSLTPEGRIYIECLEEILESESNMNKRIKELSDTDNGSLVIGGSSHASYLILSEICAEFHKNYPKVNMTLDIGNVGTPQVLFEKLDNKEIDVLVTYNNNTSKYIVDPILEERLVIAMSKKMPGTERFQHLALSRNEILTKKYSPEREIEDTTIFSDFEFLEFARNTDTSRRMTKILGNYKPSRYKIENARHSEMHYNLMCAGVGAVVTTSSTIAQKNYDEDILFFVPKNEESYRKIYLTYNFTSKDNPLIKNFVRVAKKLYSPQE